MAKSSPMHKEKKIPISIKTGIFYVKTLGYYTLLAFLR